MLFSRRQGYVPSLKDLQTEGIDSDLRTRLWNLLTVFYWDSFSGYRGELSNSNMDVLVLRLWHNLFKWSIENRPAYFSKALESIRSHFFKCEWFEVYDFIEFIIPNSHGDLGKGFTDACNGLLEEESSGYRLIAGKFTPITSEIEVAEVQDVLESAQAFPGVKAHINTALRMLSDRSAPDYRNSVKESISAVESLCQALTGNKTATLGNALKALDVHAELHGAFKAGLSSLYGYTSDSDGIRHAMLEEPNISFSDAKFMLVACSGFVNYVIGKVAELNISVPQLPE